MYEPHQHNSCRTSVCSFDWHDWKIWMVVEKCYLYLYLWKNGHFSLLHYSASDRRPCLAWTVWTGPSAVR